MPRISPTKKIPFILLAEDCTTKTNGFLSVTKAKKKQCIYQRAVFRVTGDPVRKYGTNHQDAFQTAKDLLDRFPERIENMEKNRVLEIVKEVYGTTGHGSQPRFVPPRPVATIHQIYGLFRDGKAMPRLFQNSQQRWRHVARQMGAHYHLWSADEVDALMKKHYAQLWATYKNVPFPVMRADMARIAILHRYGGMYVDLDVFPNSDTFAQVPLAVQKAYTSGYNTVKAKRHSMKKKHSVYDKANTVDIEVLIASQYNPVLIRWLTFIRNELAKRDYKKTKFGLAEGFDIFTTRQAPIVLSGSWACRKTKKCCAH